MAAAKKVKPNVINITAAFNHGGKHYQGMVLFEGVGFGLMPAPCGEDRQLIDLTNAGVPDVDWPTSVFWDTTSCVNDKSSVPVPGYLKIKPE